MTPLHIGEKTVHVASPVIFIEFLQTERAIGLAMGDMQMSALRVKREKCNFLIGISKYGACLPVNNLFRARGDKCHAPRYWYNLLNRGIGAAAESTVVFGDQSR